MLKHPRRRVFLFRHGETDYNREYRFQGHLDIPLNDTGRTQAKKLVMPLRPLGLQAILSSDLNRAVETGAIVAKALGIPIYQSADLREAFIGEAQGLTVQEIESRFGQVLSGRWRSNEISDADAAYPGGESGSAIFKRALNTINHFFEAHSAYGTVGIATHGGVIRRLIQHLASVGAQHIPIPNGIVYPLSFDFDSLRWIPDAWIEWQGHSPR